MTDLLAVCPEHPRAMVLHAWSERRLEYRTPGPQVDLGWTLAHQWTCAVCGRRLAGPEKCA